MIHLAVLASTKATDMQAIIDAINAKELDAQISVVISDKLHAYALARANKYDIDAIFVDPNDISREEFDKKVDSVLQQNEVDLILLIGYMRILSSFFVNKWKNKIMNIHPSLLPDFAGGMDKDVHQKVLDSGVKETGCTLHFVTEGVDTGPIILQKRVSIEENETVDTLKEKVQKAEQEIILKAIKLFAEGKIKVEGNEVKIQND